VFFCGRFPPSDRPGEDRGPDLREMAPERMTILRKWRTKTYMLLKNEFDDSQAN
jgi:hypothetical protein